MNPLAVISHYREILFLKDEYWIIRDYLKPPGPRWIKLWFHFDAEVAPLRDKEHTIRVIEKTVMAPGYR